MLHEDNSLIIKRNLRGFTEKYTIDKNFLVSPEAELDNRDELMDNFYVLDKVKARAGS